MAPRNSLFTAQDARFGGTILSKPRLMRQIFTCFIQKKSAMNWTRIEEKGEKKKGLSSSSCDSKKKKSKAPTIVGRAGGEPAICDPGSEWPPKEGRKWDGKQKKQQKTWEGNNNKNKKCTGITGDYSK